MERKTENKYTDPEATERKASTKPPYKNGSFKKKKKRFVLCLIRYRMRTVSSVESIPDILGGN